MTGRHSSYGWLRLPRIPARVLAFYTCSRVPASCGPMRGSPWLPRIRNVRLDTVSDPGEYPCRSPERDTDCCLPAGRSRRHSPTKIFGAQHLQGRHHPLPLHLACCRAYASTRLLPVAPQGSIPGSRLAITQAGVPPARTRGLARPHRPLFQTRRERQRRDRPRHGRAASGAGRAGQGRTLWRDAGFERTGAGRPAAYCRLSATL